MVLGARKGSGNIGEAVVNELRTQGWWVSGNHCRDANGDYVVPEVDYSTVDALVITLGKEGLTPWLTCSEEDITEVVYGSLVLPLLAVRAWAQARAAQGGTCVVVGSYAYDHAPTGCAPYCAAKAGLAQAIVELGWELTERGFYFHIVHPYHVPSTPMGQRVVEAMVRERGFTREAAVEYQKKDMRMGRHLTPEEVATVVGWLVTEPAAQWLSGQGLNLYGGVR